VITVLALVVAGGGVSGLLVWGVVALKRASDQAWERLTAAWRAAGSQLGGRFVPSAGRSQPMTIEAVVDGVGIVIDHYTVSAGDSENVFTRVSALAEGPVGFKLSMKPGVLASIGRALGAQDVVVGDPVFDEAFVVKTSDEDLARAWLAPGVTPALSAAADYLHALAKGRVTATRKDIESSSVHLIQVARATAAVAGRGGQLRSEWRRVAHDLGGIVESELWGHDEPRIEIQARGSRMTVELTRLASGLFTKRLVTRVWARRVGARPDRFVAAERGTLTEADGEVVPLEGAKGRVEVRSSLPRVTAGRFDRELTEALEGLTGARMVAGDDEVAVIFPGLLLQAPPLKLAVTLVAGLTSSGPEGPYR